MIELDPQRTRPTKRSVRYISPAGQTAAAEAAYRKGAEVNPKSSSGSHRPQPVLPDLRASFPMRSPSCCSACRPGALRSASPLVAGTDVCSRRRLDEAERLYAELKKACAQGSPSLSGAWPLLPVDRPAGKGGGGIPVPCREQTPGPASHGALDRVPARPEPYPGSCGSDRQSFELDPRRPPVAHFPGPSADCAGKLLGCPRLVLTKAVRAESQIGDMPTTSWVLLRRTVGLPDLAKTSLARSLELNPRMADAAAALAGLNARTGDLAEA